MIKRECFRVILRCFLLAITTMATARGVPAGEKAKSPPLFEVRGSVMPPDGVNLRINPAFVQLGNPVGPPVSGVDVDEKGRFRIRKVPAGMYLVTAYVPRMARAKQTVEVGPSLADSKGRITVTLKLENSSGRPNRYLVPVDQLAIPDQAREEYAKGRRSYGGGQLDRAVEQFRRATEIAPSFGAAWNQLAAVEFFMGNFRAAAEHFLEAGKHMPGNYQVLISRGAALLAARDGAAAATVNSRAVEERPTDAQAQAQLGASLFMLDKFDEAETHLRKAIELDPANFCFPQLHLAEIYRRRGDGASMKKELEEFLRLHPDSPKALEIRPILGELQSLMLNRRTP